MGRQRKVTVQLNGKSKRSSAKPPVEPKAPEKTLGQQMVDRISRIYSPMLEVVSEKLNESFWQHFKASNDVTELMPMLSKFISEYHTYMCNKLLVVLDRQPHAQRWICPKCGHRWGRHNDRLQCPKMGLITRESINP